MCAASEQYSGRKTYAAWNKLRAHNGGECTRNIIHYFCSDISGVFCFTEEVHCGKKSRAERDLFIVPPWAQIKLVAILMNAIVLSSGLNFAQCRSKHRTRLLPFNTPRSGVKISDNTLSLAGEQTAKGG
jgi:hypothetical protein